MCLQDYQLARAELLEVYEFNIAAPGNGILLPSNPQRVRLLITGPNTGTILILLGAPASRRTVYRKSSAFVGTYTALDIRQIGNAITERLFFEVSAASQFTIFEYSLPVDPVSLKRLADAGKW